MQHRIQQRLPWIVGGAGLAFVGALLAFAAFTWLETRTVEFGSHIPAALAIALVTAVLIPSVPGRSTGP
ncbi:MAG: hypothetical protein IRZ14_20495 [Chloroflexi bacterium]|nr:hypothetical protein [Chloroflexota bacterium]